MVAVPAQAPQRPPALLEATKKSTSTWQDDLQSLFHHAKDRFPDVVWELVDDDAPIETEPEEVWGHKAIVYARAPPSFQARYFSFRPPPIASPVPYSTSPTPTHPAQSSISLSLGVDYPTSLRSASPYRTMSPTASSINGTIMRIPTSNNPTLFSKELEYLYTGKGFGEAFEFLFDTAEKREEGDAEENRIDKLRKDLVFMWRSRLYSDVRIEILGASPLGTPEDESTAAFSSHRFILISRSPYFFDHLVTYNLKTPVGEAPTIRLPTPPFTPPALHFILGYLYTGTLHFSNRTYDLDTAFHIMRCGTYLQLNTLYDEVQARIVQEMMHGLFHAFLEFEEYERITGSKWGTGGCRCRQCARRAPRVLEFSLQPDVKNAYLERGTRRALVGLFGEGWCTPEFATLPQKTKDGLLKGLAKRTAPLNIFPLLFAAQAAMSKLNGILDTWADGTREMVLTARKTIDEVLCAQAEICFEQGEWVELMEADGGRFEDGEKVELVMESLKRGLSEKNAATLYQTLVSAILLKPHPTEQGDTLLSQTSHIRVQVEQTRVDVLGYLKRRWVGVRQEGGFDTLEGWALKEISHEIDVPVEDLLNPTIPAQRTPAVRVPQRRAPSRNDDTESIHAQSLRASVLSRNAHRPAREPVTSSGASVRSVARSTMSTASRASTSTVSPSVRASRATNKDTRPDSKLTPSSSSQFSMDVDNDNGVVTAETGPAMTQAGSLAASRRAGSTVTRGGRTIAAERPKSSAASIAPSVKSHASTIRKASTTTAGSSTTPAKPTLRPSTSSQSTRLSSRPVSSVSNTRPVSSVSTRSETSSAFKTAPESMGAGRRVSTASTASATSNRSVKPTGVTPKPPVPPIPASASASAPAVRSRKSSTASVASNASSVTPARGKTPTTPGRLTLSPGNAVKRVTSSSSVRSNVSTASKRIMVKRPSGDMDTATRKGPVSMSRSTSSASVSSLSSSRAPPPVPSKDNLKALETAKSLSKGKGKENGNLTPTPSSSVTSEHRHSSSSSTTIGKASTVRRKGSNETITLSSPPAPKSPMGQGVKTSSAVPPATTTIPATTPVEIQHPQPKGSTLDIGIPCIISSKRKRFRAFARYIGEVEGEIGPWVGVEVPFGEQWSGEQFEGQQWNDGSWGGIRYFSMGTTSEWGDEDYTGRNRRRDWMGGGGGFGHGFGGFGFGYGNKGIKREGDQLAVDRKKRFRSASPAVSDVSMSECRGLFVRPQQVVYVVDAVDL